MNVLIPQSYNLNIRDLYKEYIYSKKNNNEIVINNFKLYINKYYLIYKISSSIKLEYLLDFLNGYEEIVIKKIYYYLIIKYLRNLNIKIKYNYSFFNCINNEWFDIVLRTREYHICYNNKIIITDIIKYNICLIIINKTNQKFFISIIDKNCIIDCLYELIENNIYNNNRYEDIQIIIIGGSIDNINIIINIYNILKNLKISKYIFKTHILKKNPLNRLKINTSNNSISFISDNDYYNCFGDDNSDHINNCIYSSILKKI